MSLYLAKKHSQRSISTSEELRALFQCERFLLEEVAGNPGRHYGYLRVPKNDGSWREVRPPNIFLKQMQVRLLRYLYKGLRLPGHLHGALPQGNRTLFAAKARKYLEQDAF